MVLYEYFCNQCEDVFEQLHSLNDPEAGKCPKCQKINSKKLISRFAVGGQGDLRESTQHGCHDCEVSPGPAGGHSHQDEE